MKTTISEVDIPVILLEQQTHLANNSVISKSLATQQNRKWYKWNCGLGKVSGYPVIVSSVQLTLHFQVKKKAIHSLLVATVQLLY